VKPGRRKADCGGIHCSGMGGGRKAGWVKRRSRPVGQLGQLGRKLKEIPFRIKNKIFEFI
jgi:hypothetical protein